MLAFAMGRLLLHESAAGTSLQGRGCEQETQPMMYCRALWTVLFCRARALAMEKRSARGLESVRLPCSLPAPVRLLRARPIGGMQLARRLSGRKSVGVRSNTNRRPG